MHIESERIYMKIIHVAEYASGGVATYLRDMIAYQLKDVAVDEVVLFNSNRKSEVLDFESSKFKHITFSYTRSISELGKLFKLRGTIDSMNPDIVNFHSSFAGIIRLTYFLKAANYKIFYCAHGWSFIQQNKTKLERKIYELIERSAAKKTDVIINVSRSEEQKALAHKLPAHKMDLIYNAIPNKKQVLPVKDPFSASKARKILFIGRFDEAKGLHFLLKNAALKENNLELVVIGESVLDDVNEDLKVDNVKFLGWIDNKYIDSYIHLCDAVIIPSKWEGFGLVALEAMKNEKMVITSDAGGLAEIIVNNYSGIIFKANSAKHLNEALSKFSKMQKNKIIEMGAVGLNILKTKYNYNQSCAKLLESYKSQLSDNEAFEDVEV